MLFIISIMSELLFGCWCVLNRKHACVNTPALKWMILQFLAIAWINSDSAVKWVAYYWRSLACCYMPCTFRSLHKYAPAAISPRRCTYSWKHLYSYNAYVYTGVFLGANDSDQVGMIALSSGQWQMSVSHWSRGTPSRSIKSSLCRFISRRFKSILDERIHGSAMV